MRTQSRLFLLCLVIFVIASIAGAQAKPEPAASQQKPKQQEWIKRSNEYAQILIKVQAKYGPEFAARQGVEGLDDQISQFPADRREKAKADEGAALEQLQKALATEKDP